MIRLDKHATAIGVVTNILTFLSVIVLVLYFIFPSFQREMEKNFTARGAWFYMGATTMEGKWDYIDSEGKPTLERNFYHTSWQERGTRHNPRSSIKIDEIKSVAGSIVVPFKDYPIMGRKGEPYFGGDGILSNNPINTVAFKGECLYVNEVRHKVLVNKNVFWAWAAKVTCH